MLYTKKGDSGTTKLFSTPSGVRIKKSDPVFAALGGLDELNSSLGFAKALSQRSGDFLYLNGAHTSYARIIERLQNALFSVQAEIAGSDKRLVQQEVDFAELVIAEVETLLPPVTSFVVPGGSETGAYLDVVRTTARHAERSIVKLLDTDRVPSDIALQFINRLSSVAYALARFANYQEGYSERRPLYQ